MIKELFDRKKEKSKKKEPSLKGEPLPLEMILSLLHKHQPLNCNF
jgi:hypothetical protein